MQKFMLGFLTLLLGISLYGDLLESKSEVDGYDVRLYAKKSLVVGENDFFVTLQKEGQPVTDAKVKVKFFMPEMPGMPYMEYKAKAKLQKDGSYKMRINLSMGGTWQYHLKFKSSDGAIHKLHASVNL